MNVNIRPLVLASAIAMLFACHLPANAAETGEDLSCAAEPEMSDMKPSDKAVSANALITRIETAYEEARKGLTDNQRAYLDRLVAEEQAIVRIDAEYFNISSAIQNCKDPNAEPTLTGPFDDALRELKSIKDHEKRERNRLHFQHEYNATFIDERILREYLQLKSMQTTGEMARDAIAGAGIMNCEEGKAKLAEYHLLPGGTSLPANAAPQ